MIRSARCHLLHQVTLARFTMYMDMGLSATEVDHKRKAVVKSGVPNRGNLGPRPLTWIVQYIFWHGDFWIAAGLGFHMPPLGRILEGQGLLIYMWPCIMNVFTLSSFKE
jgi:hypothetical protein